MKKIFTFCLLAVMSITAWANDFEVEYKGKAICYNILADSVSVEVTYKGMAPKDTLFYQGDITIPASVEYTDATTGVTKTYKVRAIGGQAFKNCRHVTSVTFEATIDSICTEAFRICEALKTLPDISHVDSIPDFTFDGCSSITSVEIPANVKFIGYGAFGTLTSLTSLTVAAENTVYSSPLLDDGVTPSNCVMLTAAKALVVACNKTVIPTGTKSLYGSAFFGCSGIETLVLPETVDSVGGSVFQDCTGLKSITLSGGIKIIGKSLFNGCSALESITLNEGTTAILGSAFQDCTSLKEISIPATVDTIGFTSFGGCAAMEKMVVDPANTKFDSREDCNAIIQSATNILMCGCKTTVIPNTVLGIGGGAFESCTSLASISIPEGVKFIGEASFQDCPLMTKVVLPEGLDSIGDSAFKGCKGLTSINIPSGVKKISANTFWRCSALPSITLPEGIDSIGDEAFRMCSKLTSINIPDGLKTIGGYAFEGDSLLPSITFPASVDSIADYAFKNCVKLATISFNSVPFVGQESFNIIAKDSIFSLALADGAYVYTGTNYFPVLHKDHPATYTRQLASEQQWGTLVLPFAMVNDDKYKFYKLSSAKKDVLDFVAYNNGDTIAANTPVVFKAAEAGAEVVFTASNDSVTASSTFNNSSEYADWTMTGTYEAVKKNSTAGGTQIYYIGITNEFYYANQEFPVSGFRGWFETTNTSNAKTLAINVTEFDATGIAQLKADTAKRNDSFYNLAGQKVSSGAKGIVIINGKKVFNK